MEIDLTQVTPAKVSEMEVSMLKEILPKLAGLKKIIATAEARAKELLTADPNAFDGEWVLSDGAMDRRIVDAELFVEAMMGMRNPLDEYPIGPKDLLAIATFPVGKAESLIMEKFGWPKKMAAEALEGFGPKVIEIGRKAPSLKEGK